MWLAGWRSATTHLVARHVGTHKYKLAVLNGIPVVSEAYLPACAAANQARPC